MRIANLELTEFPLAVLDQSLGGYCRLVLKKMQKVMRASLIFRGVFSSLCSRRTVSVSLNADHSVLPYRGSELSRLCLTPTAWLAKITGEGHPTLPEKGICLVKSFPDSTCISDSLNPKLSYLQRTLERKVKVSSVS